MIYSELPEFVTARANLKQIEQMAAMDEVSYIKAPGINAPIQHTHAP